MIWRNKSPINGVYDAEQSVVGLAVDFGRGGVGGVLREAMLGAIDGEQTHPQIRRRGQYR